MNGPPDLAHLGPPDLAHLGPVQLLTPRPQESLDFFERVMGMEVVARERQSVYLRGWDDYQRWCLRLTESGTSGIGYMGLRAWNEEVLKRRCALIQAAGLGEGWEESGDLGLGRAYRFRDPDGHVFRLYSQCERYDPPEHLRPALKNVHGRYTARGIAVKRLDHVNILAADVRANREFCVQTLGYRLYERIEREDGSEAGAWMSLSIAAHELIYTADAHGAHGRLHHLAFWVDSREECLRAADIWLEEGIHIEAAPSKHAIAQGFFLYGYEPGGNRIEVTSGGRFLFAPDEPCVVWTAADRAKGQAWGVQTVESFHTYGTPPL
ncbi:MAG: VOC family protein [Solirubrobacteraceae bacterium]